MVVMVTRGRVAPQVPVEPGGPTLIFEDTFASGAFTNWASCQWNAGGSIRNDNCLTYDGVSDYSATVADGGVGHPNAARFELRDGDIPFSTTERTEIAEPRGANVEIVPGDERWIAWDMKFNSDFPLVHSSSVWCVIWQWHGNAAGSSPPVCLDIQDADDVIYLANNDVGGWRIAAATVDRGVWHRWVVHVKFSDDAGVGFVQLWIDGAEVIPQTLKKTMVTADSGCYFKTGIYRDPINVSTAILWHDNIRMTAP